MWLQHREGGREESSELRLERQAEVRRGPFTFSPPTTPETVSSGFSFRPHAPYVCLFRTVSLPLSLELTFPSPTTEVLFIVQCHTQALAPS